MASKLDTGAEVIFSSGKADAHARRLSRAVADGSLRRIYAGVFTSNLDSPLETVVQRHWSSIVGYLLPGAVLALSSGWVQRPENGVLHVRRGSTRRTVELPGLVVQVHPGPGAITESPSADVPYQGIFVPTEERTLLENLYSGRGSAALVKSQADIEARLDRILTLRGEFKLNELRDRARAVATQLNMPKEQGRLEGLIGALLGTHEEKKLKSQQALARAAGRPYDPERVELFDTLRAELAREVLPQIPEQTVTWQARENFAFFEGYFSNFIEGTTFEVAEAEQIVFEGAIIPNRSEDSHDILSTFRAAMNSPWRDKPATTDDAFLDWLKGVNAMVMQARPDKNPGEWKDRANQAGNTLFVAPELVPGTLREGFVRIKALEDPMARAFMTMFVVTEVHPFRDGNGRTARLAMNAVLTAAGLCRIIVPTVYREDYLLPLKRLTNAHEAQPYIRSLMRIQDWTARLNYNTARSDVKEALERCNAFKEDLRNFKLIFPD